MNWLRNLMLFRLLMLSIQQKKLSTSQKIEEIEKEIPKHNKYITANKFNKLTKENFAA